MSRGDAAGALIWIVLGAAIATGGWRMDRLERFQIKPWEVPGLVPGLLGVALALLGIALLVRSLRHAVADASDATARAQPGFGPGVVVALILCIAYAVGLVGRMPFWLATALFVASFVLLLDRDRQRALGRTSLSLLARAALHGVVTGIVVWQVFERIFLVRLP